VPHYEMNEVYMGPRRCQLKSEFSTFYLEDQGAKY